MPETTHQYITFKLGTELFAINVEQVREVLEVPAITKVITAPDYVKGVVNVRGQAIPVVDLRLRFGLPPTADNLSTRLIVMELHLDGEVTVLGGIADSVHQVIELAPAEINPPPNIANHWRSEFIVGMVSRGDNFLMILDVSAVFTTDQLACVRQAVTEPEPSIA